MQFEREMKKENHSPSNSSVDEARIFRNLKVMANHTHMTRVLQWLCTGFLGRIGWDDEQGQLSCIREKQACMELCHDPDESVWVWAGWQTTAGDIGVGICCGLCDKKEAADHQASSGQLEKMSCLLALVLMEDSDNADICRRDNTEGQLQSHGISSWREEESRRAG